MKTDRWPLGGDAEDVDGLRELLKAFEEACKEDPPSYDLQTLWQLGLVDEPFKTWPVLRRA